jgi:formiminotetrahydrofolate cyclodeaminase
MEEPQEPFADLTLEALSARLASDEPVPGGGSASAVAGALGASLLAMVAGLSSGRPKYESYADAIARGLRAGEAGRRRLLDLADEDARAYGGYVAARRLPAETADERAARDAAMRAAARASTETPLEIVRQCRVLAEEIEALAGRSNLNAASDLGVAAHLVEAAANGAGANILINLPGIADPRFEGAATAELQAQLDAIGRLSQQTHQIVADGQLREPEAE